MIKLKMPFMLMLKKKKKRAKQNSERILHHCHVALYRHIMCRHGKYLAASGGDLARSQLQGGPNLVCFPSLLHQRHHIIPVQPTVSCSCFCNFNGDNSQNAEAKSKSDSQIPNPHSLHLHIRHCISLRVLFSAFNKRVLVLQNDHKKPDETQAQEASHSSR